MASRSGTHAGKTIQAVETAMDVLAALREHGSTSLAELDSVLPQSKSTLHHHLATLEQAGFVESEDGTYRLGLRLLSFATSAREASDVFDVSRETVERLARDTGELARLVVERDGRAITIHRVAGEHVEHPWFALGAVEPLHATAAGKALLAALPEHRVDRILEAGPLEAYTGQTVTRPGALRAELEEVSSRGVAFADEERFEGVRGVATTVTDETGEVLGAVSVAGATDRVDDERFRDELPVAVENVAGVAEVAATYADWADEA